jgi:dTDP-4-amino-4,6-dideoxygalactose transaminase
MQVPFFKPWITEQDKNAVVKALSSRWLTNGPILEKFENIFSKYLNVNHSIGVSNATSGLHLILRALSIGPTDEVIVPTLTFTATADVVTFCGAKPILADVNKDTFNILPSDIKKKITKNTKAIIVVHYGGQACEMDEIISISKKYGIKIIEDCAHALGSIYEKKYCGGIGTAGCFSFYPTKIITTGEGGMVTTNNQLIKKIVSGLRSHGMNVIPRIREKKGLWNYDIREIGYNYRLDEIRASLGISQFSRINTINKMRIRIAKKYDKKLQKIKGITIPKTFTNRNHIFHLYTIKVAKDYPYTRNELFSMLNKNGIGSSVQYTPLHLLSYNKGKYIKNSFPNANELKDQIISLPIYPTMKDKEIDYVISKLEV